jgi:hypothetical protein
MGKFETFDLDKAGCVANGFKYGKETLRLAS